MTAASPALDEPWAEALLAARLLAIDPAGLGGAVLNGGDSPARSVWLDVLKNALDPGTPWLRVPPHVSTERLTGELDIVATLAAGRPVEERGLIAAADGGILIVPAAERLAPEKAAILSAAHDGALERPKGGRSPLEHPTGVSIVALDEGTDDERLPASLADRLAFHIDFQAIGFEGTGGAHMLPDAVNGGIGTTIPEPILEALTATALALGVDSPRAAILCVRAAHAHCRLHGRREVTEDDAAIAARLVLAPRATRYPPDAHEETESPESPDQSETQDNNHSPSAPSSDLAEVLLEAVRPVLSPGILEALDGGLGRSAGGRGAGKVQNGSRRGRPAGTRRGDARRGERLNILETLRAAAPWQRLRRNLSPDRTGLHIRKQDFRVYRCKKRSVSTAVFLVDASGSAAFQRLAEAKGAVEIILADCYVRRDKVALVAFRGRGAETLLPPTRSLQRARRSLAALPGGGGTPLAAGLDAGALIADKVRRSGGVPLLVLLTDGRANIARDGKADRACALEDAKGAARAIRLAGYRSMVIDVSARPTEAARQVAQWMGARYLPLPMADAGRISQPVAAAMRAGAAAA